MSWQLFDRIRAYFRSANIYRQENLLQNQDDLSRVTQGSEFINFSTKGLIDQTNLHINRLERYKDYDQMDQMGEISQALDIYSDESALIDPETKHVIAVKAPSKKVKNELEKLFYDTLNIDHTLRPMIRYVCKFGDFPAEIVPSKNRDAVSSIRNINVYNFVRIETRFGDLVGFYFSEAMTEPIFLHPWQMMHMRLTNYEMQYRPYGRSILDGARRDFKRLRLMEDAALIYRITRAPLKRVFTIPVGNIPAHEVTSYLNAIADQFKRKRFFDPATGEVNWRYNPLIQDDDFWMPQRPDGSGPKVDNLPGAENLDQIADIMYFKKKMISALKIPFDRVGLAEGDGKNDKGLAATNSDFAKAVQFVQGEVATALKKVALVHLALRGFSVTDASEFNLSLTASSAIDELYRIETWNSRATVIGNLKDTGLFPDEWILKHFTDMTDDEIMEMQNEKMLSAIGGTEETPEIGAGDAPSATGLTPEVGAETAPVPGVGERLNKDLAKKVIAEYRNLKVSKPGGRLLDLPNVFDQMTVAGELNGLPVDDEVKSKVITESSDPFDAIKQLANADTDTEVEVDKHDDPMLLSTYDGETLEEVKELLRENRDIIRRQRDPIKEKGTTNAMVLPESG